MYTRHCNQMNSSERFFFFLKKCYLFIQNAIKLKYAILYIFFCFASFICDLRSRNINKFLFSLLISQQFLLSLIVWCWNLSELECKWKWSNGTAEISIIIACELISCKLWFSSIDVHLQLPCSWWERVMQMGMNYHQDGFQKELRTDHNWIRRLHRVQRWERKRSQRMNRIYQLNGEIYVIPKLKPFHI